MAKIYLGNVNIGGSGIVPVNDLPTANETNYNKHELYLNDGELKYIDYSNGTYDYKTLASQDLVSLISFTIGGVSYQAESGMTWSQWCNSEYNNTSDGWRVVSNDVWNSTGTRYVSYNNSGVYGTDEIVADRAYTTSIGGGGNN